MLHSLRINDGLIRKNNTSILHLQNATPEDVYRALGCSYPKFFKMDLLCKWAWLGAEALLKDGEQFLYNSQDKDKIAVVLATREGCLSVDRKYQDTIQTIASPALFVYTLPNIMLGEICIRHGFKGEQLCLVQDHFNEQEVNFWVQDLLKKRNMDHCLFGWVNATEESHDVCLFWATADETSGITDDAVNAIYNT